MAFLLSVSLGFQMLKVQSPEVEKPQKIFVGGNSDSRKSETRQITTSPSVNNTPETGVDETVTNGPQEDTNIAPPDMETTPVPETRAYGTEHGC